MYLQVHRSVKQPCVRRRSSVSACTDRTAAIAALVGTLMSNGVSSPAPSDTTFETRSGRRWASALAKCAPREWPTSATFPPDCAQMSSSRSSSRSTARSEQSTLAVMPEPRAS